MESQPEARAPGRNEKNEDVTERGGFSVVHAGAHAGGKCPGIAKACNKRAAGSARQGARDTGMRMAGRTAASIGFSRLSTLPSPP